MSEPVLDVATYGAFVGAGEAGRALSSVRLELLAVDLITEWGRCSVAADFLARYLGPSFGSPTTAALVLSTVANELIENAAKFSAGPDHEVRLEAHHFGDELRLHAANVVEQERARVFAHRLHELMTEDVDELFLRRLAAPTGGIGGGAGIGLMILKKDYGARVAARLLPRAGGRLYDVEVQITLSSEEIEQR